ncbi:hypothetical protein DMENIID0001_146160 [Sergentomyia squamirostris]
MFSLVKHIRIFVTIYKCFLLLPAKKICGISLVRCRILTSLTITFVILYWLGLILGLYTNSVKTNIINKTANNIQLVINAFMLTVVFLNPCLRFKRLERILANIQLLDNRLFQEGIFLNYSKFFKISLGTLISTFCLIVYIIALDAYLSFTIHKEGVTITYWLVSIIPVNFLLLTDIQLSLFLLYILIILKHSKKILREEMIKPPGIISKNSEKTVKPLNYIPGIFSILSDLRDLADNIDNYFGPIFLVNFASIFVSTSIQLYYVYLVSTAQETTWDFRMIFSFLASINIIVPNFIVAGALCFLCQCIRNLSRKSVIMIQKIQTRGSLDISPQDVQKIVSKFPHCTNEITFSAVEFFTINLNLLIGMCGSILTYLIIFIQFSNIEKVFFKDGVFSRVHEQLD